MKLYQVDAFTEKVFSGNPAAIILLDAWPDDHLMQSIGTEKLSARQLSPRGGYLKCELFRDRVLISGQAVMYMKGEIVVKL